MSKAKEQTKKSPHPKQPKTEPRVPTTKKKGPASLPQFAAIEFPFGDEIPIIHCPFCGKATMELSETGEGTVTACPHLLFMFVDLSGEFEYMSSDFKKRLKKADIELDSIEDFKQVLTDCGYGNEVLAIEMSSCGMACGPCGITVTHAFDFSVRTKA